MEPLTRLATYPFIPEAQDWVKTLGPRLDELLKDRAYATARSMGKRRLLVALEKERVWGSRFDTDPESINELLSYIISRILASVVGDKYLIRRFALAEAERVNHRLQDEDLGFVLRVCDVLNVDAVEAGPTENGGEMARMHFLTFLRNTSQMRAQEWKLVNMNVKDGFVLLEKKKVCRIVQEVIRRRFEGELPLPINQGIKDALSAEALELIEVIEEKKKMFEPEGMGEVRAECFPPCIVNLVGMAQRGENIAHMGRFALATFLHTIGMGNEEILKVFAQSPDFREDLALYQIEHVTGVISGTEYTPPECTTMVSFSLCINKDRLCSQEWMTHPLKYYRTKLKSYRREKGKGKPPSEPTKKEGKEKEE